MAAMHVAKVLGIAAEDVQPLVGDTSSICVVNLSFGNAAFFFKHAAYNHSGSLPGEDSGLGGTDPPGATAD